MRHLVVAQTEIMSELVNHRLAHLANRFRAHFGRELLRVGRITEGAGVRLANGAAIAPSGWDHISR